MSDRKVERVARALIVWMDVFAAPLSKGPATASWNDYSPQEKRIARQAAKAVIASLPDSGDRKVAGDV